MTTTSTVLPEWSLPITPTLVVSTAIATRDFQDVHHDRDLAVQRGSKDIFLNILTTTGLVQRYVGAWAREAVGEDVRITSCALRLGAPAHPYDTLAFSGTATRDGHRWTVDVVGAVSLGAHVNATVTLQAEA
ncbi:MAG: beta-hydroxyacyl-ACP dehydratase [Marmoricola sp.]